MRALLLASVSATAFLGIGEATLAADLPVPEAPIVSPSIAAYNWSGFYLGGHAGMVFGDNENQDICDSIVSGRDEFGDALDEEELECGTVEDGRIPRFVSFGNWPGVAFTQGDGGDNDELDFIAGGQVGYNWQVGRGVFGVEGDASLTSWGHSRTHAFDVYDKVGLLDRDVVGRGNIEEDVELDWLATLRGRAGLVLGDQGRLLLYGTGGLAVADIDVSLEGSFEELGAGCGECGFAGGGEIDDFHVGYAVGGGAEYAITNRVSLGLEYLYTDFGEDEQQLTFLGPGEEGNPDQSELTFEREYDLEFHTIRGKVNVRF